MRKPHPVFDRNVNPDARVWRYFDFAKFAAFLHDRSLYFSRVDLLGDPLEGSFTRAYAAQREAMLQNPPEGRTRQDLEAVFRHNEQILAGTRREGYVNCWHLGDHESMAMWRGYGGSYGVAIRSTFQRVDQTIPETFSGPYRQEDIYVGRANYIDYSSLTQRLPNEFNSYGQLMCKSLVYRHENELRALFLDTTARSLEPNPPVGHHVRVNVEELVEAVVISPLAPPWFASVIQRTCSALGFSFNIAGSIAAGAAVY